MVSVKSQLNYSVQLEATIGNLDVMSLLLFDAPHSIGHGNIWLLIDLLMQMDYLFLCAPFMKCFQFSLANNCWTGMFSTLS